MKLSPQLHVTPDIKTGTARVALNTLSAVVP